MTLRTILTIVMSLIGGIAVCIALALIVLTSSLYEAGLNVGAAAERVRLLMEVEAFGLQHVGDPGGSDPEPALAAIHRLAEASGPTSGREVARLEGRVRSLREAETPPERQAGFDALVDDLRAVIAREDERTRRALADSAAASRIGNGIGIAAVLALLLGVFGVLAWLWRSALQPLVLLVDAIGRFARGDDETRVAEQGPHEVRQVAIAFNDMVSSLRQQREQQLAFIGGVAHDLRSPLSALEVAVAALDQPSTDLGRVRDRARRQISRMEQMIGDLLDRTRIEAGHFELHREVGDLRELVTRVVGVQRDCAPARPFHLHLTDDFVPVRCDPLRIEQVATNLLNNAVKYSSPPSGVDITVDREGAMAVLAVRDHGIGMTGADRDNAFRPFRRGRNAAHTSGTGLGLAVSRRIVEAHGGQIEVSSEPGAGSRFVVRLPLADAAVSG